MHSNSESKFIDKFARARQSTGGRNLPSKTTGGLAKSHFLTKRPLIRAGDSRGQRRPVTLRPAGRTVHGDGLDFRGTAHQRVR
jgi:hypothetical protein